MKDYLVTSAKEVGEPDQYGNKAFSVFFENETKPVFMKTKAGNEPTPDKPEYGIITDEPKKSGDGTYRKFTRKQKEEGVTTTQTVNVDNKSYPVPQGKEITVSDGMAWGNALTNATSLVGQGGDPSEVLKVAEMFFNHRFGLQDKVEEKVEEEVPVPEPKGEVGLDIDPDGEIDLDDIPF